MGTTMKGLMDACNLSTQEFEALIGAILPEFVDEFDIDPNDEKFTVDDILANSEMSEMLVSSVIDWAKANKGVTAKAIAEALDIPVVSKEKDLPYCLNSDNAKFYEDTKTGKIVSVKSATIHDKRFKLVRNKLTPEQIEEKTAKKCIIKYIVDMLKGTAGEIIKGVTSTVADQVIPMPIANNNSDNGVTFAQAIKSPIAYATK